MFQDLFSLMGMMFLLIVIGYILRKKGIMREEGKSTLVDIILYVILPCNILNAFLKEYSSEFWKVFPELLVSGILIQAVCLAVAKLCYNRMPEGEKAVYQYGTVCSNSGFMGNPLVEGVFGTLGLLYTSVIIIPQRVAMWTAGVSYFQKGADKKQAYLKVLVNPCMIATYIGFVIMFTHITLPAVLTKTVSSISSCCTAMTMMYIGGILVDVDFRGIANKKQIYFAFLRLIGIPLVIYAGCRMFRINALATGVCCLLSATPAGSTTSVLAAKYHADEIAAAKSVVFTTALSIITIPIWSYFLLSQI